MRNLLLFVLLAACSGGLFYCCSRGDGAVRIEKHHGENLYVCDYFKLKDDTLTVKLSDLIELIEVIKLDNDSNAMVGNGWAHCSDNYLMLRPNWKEPYKLFSRQGKYLCDVGAIGKGPGEYMAMNDAQLDEKNGRIYLMPRQTGELLMYDLQGNFIRSIPFSSFLPMGKFSVEGDKVNVLSIPFMGHARQNVKWVAFQQTLDGKILDTVSVAPYAVKIEYADWINSNREFMSYHVYQWDGIQDSLYHYIPGKNALTPVFTVNYGGVNEIPLHDYHEIQGYFWFTTYKLEEMPNGQFTNKMQKKVLVNKKTLEAGLLKIENDLLGGDLRGSEFEAGYGYYSENLSPLALRDRLEKFSKKGEINEKSKKLMDDLLRSIDDNDNNYIILGKLKK